MKTWLAKHVQPYMIRPTVYKAFTRFVYSLLASLLWNRFVNDGAFPLANVFLFFCVGFAVLAWVCYLQLDGVSMPHLTDWMTSSLPHRKPERSYGDMADYFDEEVVSYSDLEDDEKLTCKLLANLACALLFLLLSFI